METLNIVELLTLLIPVIALQFGLMIYAIILWVKHESKYFNPWIWLAIIIIINMIGPIIYMVIGKGDRKYVED